MNHNDFDDDYDHSNANSCECERLSAEAAHLRSVLREVGFHRHEADASRCKTCKELSSTTAGLDILEELKVLRALEDRIRFWDKEGNIDAMLPELETLDRFRRNK